MRFEYTVGRREVSVATEHEEGSVAGRCRGISYPVGEHIAYLRGNGGRDGIDKRDKAALEVQGIGQADKAKGTYRV